jgi:hypothetical protein
MHEGVLRQQQMREAIDREIAERTRIHQARIARLKTGAANLRAIGAPATPVPLVMLAHGDSWFDYPLTGNGLPLNNTDIIAQLLTMGNINPVILNISHHGDATTDEMSLPKQQRMIQALGDPSNWLSAGKPDAILFSGGGNDIAGDQFCIFLDFAAPGATGLNGTRFQQALGIVEASYRDLFVFRDRYAAGVRLFGHCYDFPIPNGVHPICAGPWLRPSLEYCGWTEIAKGTAIAHQALVEFKNLLLQISNDPKNDFALIDTQGVLAPNSWANELHPQPAGFRMIAEKFLDALRHRFPGRI